MFREDKADSKSVLVLVTAILTLVSIIPQCIGHEETTMNPPDCAIFKHVDANDLSINDIVVRSVSGKTACIKARFSLAIKVEAIVDGSEDVNSVQQSTDESQESARNQSQTSDSSDFKQEKLTPLGYLPLDSIVGIENTCPDSMDYSKSYGDNNNSGELEMIVFFECGKLAFNFKRDDHFYVSAIRGMVNLDANIVREFVSEQPMFFTSDLTHHFKLYDLIEVKSTEKPKAFYLTANFYNLEFEAFRNTSSRNFIRPPDDHSTVFGDNLTTGSS